MVRYILLTVLISCLSWGYAHAILSVTPAQARCLMDRTQLEVALNADYVWGAKGSKEIGKPKDCSLFLFSLFDG